MIISKITLIIIFIIILIIITAVAAALTGPRAACGPMSRPQQAAPGAGWWYPWRHRRGHAQICRACAQITSVCVIILYKYANRCGFKFAKKKHAKICKPCGSYANMQNVPPPPHFADELEMSFKKNHTNNNNINNNKNNNNNNNIA